MASDDFRNNEAEFLPTNRNRTSHIFDVDASSVVDVGSELMVDVNAVNTPRGAELDESSNIVEVVSEDAGAGDGTGGDGSGDEDGSDGSGDEGGSDTLNFEITLERSGSRDPVRGDFIAGEDDITATINVTGGEIVGEPQVRWYITADHFPRPIPNRWNNGNPPEGE